MKQFVNQIKKIYQTQGRVLKVLFLFSILLFVVNQMTGILQGMTWQDLKAVLTSQSLSTMAIIAGISLAAVLPMLLYDWVTVDILVAAGKPPLQRQRFWLAAWTTNTINNLAGFGGVIGATLRGRFYGQESSPKKVLGTVSKVALFMLSGLSLLCGATLLDIVFLRPDLVYGNYWIWLLGGSLYTPGLLTFVYLRRHHMFRDFQPRRVLFLVLGSLGQWLGALTSFLVIGYLLGVNVSLMEVYPLFVAATFIGMISMVPGGMGTFDVLMILGLAEFGVAKEVALAWLLYYRLFYYVFPFLTGVGTLLQQTWAKINDFFDGLPIALLQRLSHHLLTIMVYFAGIGMVLLATIPNLSNLSALVHYLLPFSFNLLDQTLNMLVGFLLLALARGVANRVKKAYLPTLALLAFCILNTISRTFFWRLLAFYGILIFCLILARKEFYRLKLTFTWGGLLIDSTLYGGLFILYSIVGFYSTDRVAHGDVPADFLLFPSEAIWLQGLMGVVLAAITIALLYRYLSQGEEPGEPFDYQRVHWLLTNYRGNHLSHLAYLSNKRHYFYQRNGWDKVMFTFEIRGSKLFVLGDPVGDQRLLLAASRAFYRYADEWGYQLVFYSVSADYSLLLHDLGFEFMKLGEEGSFDFTKEQAQPTGSNDYQLVSQRLLHQGYEFHLYEAPIAEEIMVELEKVSNDWQQDHKERYFSMGQFDQAYLNQAAVGVVFSPEREIIAFISLKPISASSLSYDLLRFKSHAPADIRLFLLTSLLNYARQQKLARFKIGFAPFARVGEAETSFMKERLLNTLYKYSYPVYDFQEVRDFKENFATEWEPYYLSYQRRNNILLIMLQLSLLVGRGSNKRFSPVETIRLEELEDGQP